MASADSAEYDSMVQMLSATVTIADVATLILAVVAIIASISTAAWLHKNTGPVLKVRVLYVAELVAKTPKVGETASMKITCWLEEAAGVHRQYGEKFHITPYLRAIVVNRGRLDAWVERIDFEDEAERGWDFKKSTDPEYPVQLVPGAATSKQVLYSDVLSKIEEGRRARFVAILSTADHVASGWFRVHKIAKPTT